MQPRNSGQPAASQRNGGNNGRNRNNNGGIINISVKIAGAIIEYR
jgi:hypothetical protein